MARKTSYEWSINDCSEAIVGGEYDGQYDILDHDFVGKLDHYTDADAANIDGKTKRLELVRLVHDDDENLLERQSADAELNADGVLQLPAEFDGGTKVPAKFFKELAAFNKRRAKIILSPR